MTLLKLVWNLLLHILYGTLFFCIIGAVALGLHVFVGWAETKGLPELPALGLRVLEYVVFALDAAAYLVFLIVVFLKFVKEAYRHW
jgi:hypothetical protein